MALGLLTTTPVILDTATSPIQDITNIDTPATITYTVPPSQGSPMRTGDLLL